jgi:hypothetical protein
MKTFILGMKKEATMKRAFVALFFSLALVLPAASAWSQPNFPIVSANGFSCSQTGGMVSCRGGFPGEPSPILEATGYNVVWLRAEYSGYRYTYYSDSGCLCRAEFKSGGDVRMQECTSQFGHKKIFKGGKSTLNWCEKN